MITTESHRDHIQITLRSPAGHQPIVRRAWTDHAGVIPWGRSADGGKRMLLGRPDPWRLYMPVQTTYPGVYIVENITSTHVISGVSTSVTAFVGAARKGPSDTPTPLTSYADFVRQFGDPVDAATHPMGHSVAH